MADTINHKGVSAIGKAAMMATALALGMSAPAVGAMAVPGYVQDDAGVISDATAKSVYDIDAANGIGADHAKVLLKTVKSLPQGTTIEDYAASLEPKADAVSDSSPYLVYVVSTGDADGYLYVPGQLAARMGDVSNIDSIADRSYTSSDWNGGVNTVIGRVSSRLNTAAASDAKPKTKIADAKTATKQSSMSRRVSAIIIILALIIAPAAVFFS